MQNNIQCLNALIHDQLNNDEYPARIIHSSFQTTTKIINNAAKIIIGRDTISDINKPYINNNILTIIKQQRTFKKGIVTKTLNRIRNLKRCTNNTITNYEIKLDVIANYGKKSHQKYINWLNQNEAKKKLIRAAKRKYQEKQ